MTSPTDPLLTRIKNTHFLQLSIEEECWNAGRICGAFLQSSRGPHTNTPLAREEVWSRP